MIEVKLKHPIKTGDGTLIETIGFPERLKLKVLRKLPTWLFDSSIDTNTKVNPSEYIPVLSAVLGIPEAVLDEVDLEDFAPLVGAMNDFFGLYLPTGSSSSGE